MLRHTLKLFARMADLGGERVEAAFLAANGVFEAAVQALINDVQRLSPFVQQPVRVTQAPAQLPDRSELVACASSSVFVALGECDVTNKHFVPAEKEMIGRL